MQIHPLKKLARILVDHSADIQPGDRVAIEASIIAEPLVRELFVRILERGGHPYLILALQDQDELLYQYGNDDQLKFVDPLRMHAYNNFESRIKIGSSTNTRAMGNVTPSKQSIRQNATSPILETQMRRGAKKSFKWVSTIYPTDAYAMEANMGINEFREFVFQACHADLETEDPIAYWKEVKVNQQHIVNLFEQHNKVHLRGKNVDLSLSIKGRTFNNSHGRHNMPDGEIYTGPVEDSINGWVRFSYPAIFQGKVVEGVELEFRDGQVTHASANENEDFLIQMVNIDAGSKRIGKFALGTNYQIDRFIGNILFDEKIGGTFHLALGAGYPETGSKNKSKLHWDMICDIKSDSEILVDDEIIYKNGEYQY